MNEEKHLMLIINMDFRFFRDLGISVDGQAAV